jgi:hypothetical protein
MKNPAPIAQQFNYQPRSIRYEELFNFFNLVNAVLLLQDKMHVKEWLHQSAKRPVKVRFGPDEAFHLLNRKAEKLRSIDLKGMDSLACEVRIWHNITVESLV